MGLFDPPAVGIRKRISSSRHEDYDAFNQLIAQVMPDHLNSTQKGLVSGYVTAAWVFNENRNNRLPLDKKSESYIENMAMNCVRMMGELRPAALYIASELISEQPDDDTDS